MTENVTELVTNALQELVSGQREITVILRQIKEDITALSDRLDLVEKSVAALEQRSPPVHPELPQ
jgi:hypothetical protein